MWKIQVWLLESDCAACNMTTARGKMTDKNYQVVQKFTIAQSPIEEEPICYLTGLQQEQLLPIAASCGVMSPIRPQAEGKQQLGGDGAQRGALDALDALCKRRAGGGELFRVALPAPALPRELCKDLSNSTPGASSAGHDGALSRNKFVMINFLTGRSPQPVGLRQMCTSCT